MKTLFPIHRIVAATATTLLFLTGICAHATIYNWTNSAGGNWNNFTNWSPNQAPGAGDTAIITNAGTYGVNLNISPTVAVLILGASSGGSSKSLFTGSQTLTVNGLIQINAQGLFTVNGGTLGGSNMIVGTLTWSGGNLAGTMTLANSSVLNIVAGGGDGFDGLTLTNYGTVNWTNTTLYGISDTNAQIYNYGLWNAQSDNSFAGRSEEH